MDDPIGCMVTWNSSRHLSQKVRMPGSSSLTQTRTGGLTPGYNVVVMLEPSAMASRTLMIGAGAASRKKAL